MTRTAPSCPSLRFSFSFSYTYDRRRVEQGGRRVISSPTCSIETTKTPDDFNSIIPGATISANKTRSLLSTWCAPSLRNRVHQLEPRLTHHHNQLSQQLLDSVPSQVPLSFTSLRDVNQPLSTIVPNSLVTFDFTASLQTTLSSLEALPLNKQHSFIQITTVLMLS